MRLLSIDGNDVAATWLPVTVTRYSDRT